MTPLSDAELEALHLEIMAWRENAMLEEGDKIFFNRIDAALGQLLQQRDALRETRKVAYTEVDHLS